MRAEVENLVAIVFGLLLVVALCLAMTGCTVVMANRSNVNTTATISGPSRADNEQDCAPTGGANLKLPLDINEKGPDSW